MALAYLLIPLSLSVSLINNTHSHRVSGEGFTDPTGMAHTPTPTTIVDGLFEDISADAWHTKSHFCHSLPSVVATSHSCPDSPDISGIYLCTYDADT